ncbi:MAG TPA: carboxypeptidase-like regulatory domain-containing protein [Chitinophagaceae bacterium]|nr:carboxypeptidase-like regulatory domain-containing protein [Chitinophagaceae bacterium]
MNKVITHIHLIFITILLSFSSSFASELMKGKVVKKGSEEPLDMVTITNQNTKEKVYSKEDGSFAIKVSPGDEIEFRKMGMQIERTTIRSGPIPFYHVSLETGAFELPTVFIKDHSYKEDSIQALIMFEHALRAERKEDVNFLSNPFVLLDKRARQIWRFQKMFDYYESEKYIDYVFTEDLVLRINPDFNLDYMDYYMKEFRPTYIQLKSWTRYEYLEYIKLTSNKFLKK